MFSRDAINKFSLISKLYSGAEEQEEGEGGGKDGNRENSDPWLRIRSKINGIRNENRTDPT